MKIAKLTKKGQFTIPTGYRKLLGTYIVEITYEKGKVIIKPAKKLGGILHKYAIRDRSIEEIMKTEKEAIGDGLAERGKRDNC
ncbi:AbrB/MazE/SpoVT family DNA-binding domain-containing protein [Aquifex aeolicus]|uniref:AbrB/MazE/SpoVT family DNA-binding domain-containing protein n=1 Tax=Aquifex aeolicus TaxID=63363 RepID=UPI00031B5D54|nr:AbrB/MazE/SpoVT family DNA-binding domain-containing protein [Aquifex aeolicus]